MNHRGQAVQTLERDVTQREQRVADMMQANEQLHQTIARLQEEVWQSDIVCMHADLHLPYMHADSASCMHAY